MADPLTLAVLGGLVATEGVKFLFSQASDVLKAWRERRAKKAAGEETADQLEVPVKSSDALDAAPTGQEVDLAVIEQQNQAVLELIGRLAPYANDLADIDVEDVALGEAAGQLRAILEAAYGQRFTFRGEDRERTGARVSVRQVLGDVTGGSAVGANATVADGHLEVDQQVESVGEGGSVTGFQGSVG
jgi:hypothetical protein